VNGGARVAKVFKEAPKGRRKWRVGGGGKRVGDLSD